MNARQLLALPQVLETCGYSWMLGHWATRDLPKLCDGTSTMNVSMLPAMIPPSVLAFT